MNNDLFVEFDNYVKKFDILDENINLKYKHSYRVYEYAKDISNSLKLSKNDITLAMKCGLLHDIGRFSQVAEFNTFIDSKSVDHGDRGYDVLLENNFINKFTIDDEEKSIILNSVKNHNKLVVDDNLSEKEKLFTNIVRDADKIDIIMTQVNEINDEKYNNKLIDDILNRKLCNNSSVNTDVDSLLRLLSFIFDINYKRSIEILVDNNILEEKFKLLEHVVDKDTLKSIKDEINIYIKERLEC